MRFFHHSASDSFYYKWADQSVVFKMDSTVLVLFCIHEQSSVMFKNTLCACKMRLLWGKNKTNTRTECHFQRNVEKRGGYCWCNSWELEQLNVMAVTHTYTHTHTLIWNKWSVTERGDLNWSKKVWGRRLLWVNGFVSRRDGLWFQACWQE